MTKNLRLLPGLVGVVGVLVIAIAVLVPVAFTQPPPPDPDGLEEGEWNVFKPGGETICSDGSEYSFFVRPGADADKLLIYFQGGGACWNTFTCAGQFYDRTVGTPEEEVGGYQGIFDYENAENPFTEYTTVFIPFCTGDVHVGDATVDYTSALTVEHNGAVNAQSALDWTYQTYAEPSEVVVTGSSAGAIGAVYFSPQVMAQYPDAKVAAFGDGEVGAAPAGWSVLEHWNMYENLTLPEDADPETFIINDIYLTAGALYPDNQFAQFTTTGDEVQITFYDFSENDGTPWLDVMYSFIDALEAEMPNFRAFIAGGKQHTILATPGFYTFVIDGVRFVDWFTAWLNGEDVENLRCEDCEVEEVVAP